MPQDNQFWYAYNMTRVLHVPRQTLETFGTTRIRYHLISEVMDETDRIRIREGEVNSERPMIITPSMDSEFLQGFEESTREFMKSLSTHGRLLRILKYGLHFRRDHGTQELVSDTLDNVANRVRTTIEADGDAHSVVLVGSDEHWEVSLLRFLIDFIEKSIPLNMQEIQEREAEARLLRRGNLGLSNEIEADFRRAENDPAYTKELGAKLQRLGLFDKYEDRFYGLFKGRG